MGRMLSVFKRKNIIPVEVEKIDRLLDHVIAMKNYIHNTKLEDEKVEWILRARIANIDNEVVALYSRERNE